MCTTRKRKSGMFLCPHCYRALATPYSFILDTRFFLSRFTSRLNLHGVVSASVPGSPSCTTYSVASNMRMCTGSHRDPAHVSESSMPSLRLLEYSGMAKNTPRMPQPVFRAAGSERPNSMRKTRSLLNAPSSGTFTCAKAVASAAIISKPHLNRCITSEVIYAIVTGQYSRKNKILVPTADASTESSIFSRFPSRFIISRVKQRW